MADKNNWQPKLKGYPHFDAPVSMKVAISLAPNPDLVKHHKFLPFLSYKNFTKKFGSKKPKERFIRYGARKDAYIYSYYRKLLMDCYNPLLEKFGLNECVIAYRHLTYEDKGEIHGKCNINFAQEAFEEIKRRGECIAITLDISGFFESLTHDLIKQKWCYLLNTPKLPDDHYRVYKNITNYKIVDLDECYKRLGFMSVETIGSRKFRRYKYSKKEQPKQLCSMQEFRNKIAGYDPAHTSLIKGNPYSDPKADMKLWDKCQEIEYRGIPQGSPISDVIANMYMLDFDIKLKALSDKIGAYYRRYSDDILLIIPANTSNYKEIIEYIKSAVADEGNLKIKDKKTIVTHFFKKHDEVEFKSFDGIGLAKGNAFEYLGFGFDGKRILLKSQTLTRYYKKMHHGIHAIVKTASEKAKLAGSNDLMAFIDVPLIYHRYSNPNREWKNRDGRKARNFISYVKRSKSLMSDQSIQKQLRKHRKIIGKTINKAINLIKRNHS